MSEGTSQPEFNRQILERVVRLEKDVEMIVPQVGEIHEVMVKAKGARWAIVIAGSFVLGVASIVSVAFTWFGKIFG